MVSQHLSRPSGLTVIYVQYNREPPAIKKPVLLYSAFMVFEVCCLGLKLHPSENKSCSLIAVSVKVRKFYGNHNKNRRMSQ